jgi:cell division protein FtsL
MDELKREGGKLSRWNVFGIIFVSALLMILYVGNVIAIDSILEEIQNLNKQRESIRNGNELLQTEIIKLESADRIIPLAEKELGMAKPSEAPEVIP